MRGSVLLPTESPQASPLPICGPLWPSHSAGRPTPGDGPDRQLCVREDFLKPRYLYPAGIPLVLAGGPTSDTIDFAGRDITPPGFLFWYPLIWMGTSLAVGLLMVSRQRFRWRKSEALGRPSPPLHETGP